jgi:hypothetical protein
LACNYNLFFLCRGFFGSAPGVFGAQCRFENSLSKRVAHFVKLG